MESIDLIVRSEQKKASILRNYIVKGSKILILLLYGAGGPPKV
jgi:hypothetical protein